MYLGSVSINRA